MSHISIFELAIGSLVRCLLLRYITPQADRYLEIESMANRYAKPMVLTISVLVLCVGGGALILPRRFVLVYC